MGKFMKRWPETIGQWLLAGIFVVFFITPGHYEIEFAKYLYRINPVLCIVVFGPVLALCALGLRIWISELVAKYRNRASKTLRRPESL
jgi:uncharacterized membrane protein